MITWEETQALAKTHGVRVYIFIHDELVIDGDPDQIQAFAKDYHALLEREVDALISESEAKLEPLCYSRNW